jgi:hypothetical protein
VKGVQFAGKERELVLRIVAAERQLEGRRDVSSATMVISWMRAS